MLDIKVMQAAKSANHSISLCREKSILNMTQFEWDKKKAAENLRKHGISLEEASTVFYDSLSATFDDPDHSIGEHRLIVVGLSARHRLLVVC